MSVERTNPILAGFFRTSTIEQSFRSSLFVLFLSELIAVIGPLIDSFIIAANLGADGVKEFGIVNPILIAYSCIGSVFAVGSVTLCSRMIGKGQSDEARDTFSLAFVWVLILSTATAILLLLLAGPITELLGAPRDTGSFYEESKRYFIGLTISFPAVNLMPFLSAYMQVDNDRNRALISTAVLTAVNTAGDLAAVHLNAGMLGIGLATTVANYLAAVVLLLHFRKPEAFFRPHFSKLPFHKTGMLLAGGSSAFITFAGNMIMFIILNRLLIRYAPLSFALIAFTAERNVFSFMSAVCKAMGRCVMTMGGFFYGERNPYSLKELVRMIVKYTLLLAGTGTVICLLLSGLLAKAFVGGELQSIPEAAHAIRSMALSVPLLTLSISYECIFRGAGRTKISIGLTVLRDFLLPVLTAVVLLPIMNADAVYWAITISQALLLLGIAAVVIVRYRRHDEGLISAALFLPRDFQSPPEKTLMREITEIGQGMEFSESVFSLCASQGLTGKRAFYASLFAEEACRNTLEHGFNAGKHNQISAYVFIDEQEQIHISLRDNCRPFSPTEWRKLQQNDEDPTANIGIRLMSAISKEMKYVNLFNLNNLSVIL
jgi:Na+-driven multidrug efflux pump/anti-sigma regulatory factor (Ser/Thr protein kinase)